MSLSARIGRNDACPCGSGKRYKRCCGAETVPSSGFAAGEVSAAARRTSAPGIPAAPVEPSEERAIALSHYHLGVLFDGVKVGNLDFYPTYRACMEASSTKVPLWKLLRRAQRAYNLARYFHRNLPLTGARAECGVLHGFSALLLSRVALSTDPQFTGAGLHLVDSFEGLSQPTPRDAIRERALPDGSVRFEYGARQGDMASSLEHVQRVLRAFSGITFHKGWIPDVLGSLPEAAWTFVHIDVDFYEPTLACLEYFVPRLASGGVIINDDYASPLFPGGGRAWDDYCNPQKLMFTVLDTGQAVFVKDG